MSITPNLHGKAVDLYWSDEMLSRSFRAAYFDFRLSKWCNLFLFNFMSKVQKDHSSSLTLDSKAEQTANELTSFLSCSLSNSIVAFWKKRCLSSWQSNLPPEEKQAISIWTIWTHVPTHMLTCRHSHAHMCTIIHACAQQTCMHAHTNTHNHPRTPLEEATHTSPPWSTCQSIWDH